MLTRLHQHRVCKPWGRTDVPNAFRGDIGSERLGEIWFQREHGENDALLVKFLFTSERLSVQVHPDDRTAKAAGYPRGKDEAWLVLEAQPGAELGIGLRSELSPEDLRAAALDGSIVDAIDWRTAKIGDAYYSPAGTLHSIGAGLTLLEIQQNCDVTYRFFDFGRPRELHLDEAVEAAKPGAHVSKSSARPINDGRSILIEGPKFTVEHWRSKGQERLVASKDAPIWLIPLEGQIAVEDQLLEIPSVWIADEPFALRIEEDGELLVAYEGAGPRDLA